ncbi:MAG: hypothetical protein IPN92_11120 [Chromatiaceae bacterium]|nr:hypothetical protein [Chromatiaceae bacterium]
MAATPASAQPAAVGLTLAQECLLSLRLALGCEPRCGTAPGRDRDRSVADEARAMGGLAPAG